ncbi:hypothetical protein [Lichenicola sp.]|uniref:hypothetical protein n=1 Tax=Lichenicola sp. TaxID=2804529 RepID=UPI003AFFF60E
MFANSAKIVCGDVVACGASVYVVQETVEDELTLLRVERQPGTQHRADVAPAQLSDMGLSGLPLQHVVIRCVPIRRFGFANLTRLGVIPDTLRSSIQAALKREQAVRRFENGPSVRSNLTACTSSRGRRISAVRYA